MVPLVPEQVALDRFRRDRPEATGADGIDLPIRIHAMWELTGNLGNHGKHSAKQNRLNGPRITEGKGIAPAKFAWL
jgi:hypothetical protein